METTNMIWRIVATAVIACVGFVAGRLASLDGGGFEKGVTNYRDEYVVWAAFLALIVAVWIVPGKRS